MALLSSLAKKLTPLTARRAPRLLGDLAGAPWIISRRRALKTAARGGRLRKLFGLRRTRASARLERKLDHLAQRFS